VCELIHAVQVSGLAQSPHSEGGLAHAAGDQQSSGDGKARNGRWPPSFALRSEQSLTQQ